MSGGSEYFQGQFRETVAWIEWNPELFHRTYKSFRRAIIRNTYFGVFYAIETDVSTIVAVVDMRQDRKPSGKLSDHEKLPNQALEPTRPTVTPFAYAKG